MHQKILLLFFTAFFNIVPMQNLYVFKPVELVPKEFHQKRITLNADFFKNASINTMVSYIYYPTDRATQGHSELEVEGTCWTLSQLAVRKSLLEHKIIKSTTPVPSKPFKMQGKYFKRYIITVTPEELKRLNYSLEKSMLFKNRSKLMLTILYIQEILYKTCSYTVLSKLSETCNFHVPMPFKISPFLTALYIMYTVPKKINNIEGYGRRIGYDGELYEAGMILLWVALIGLGSYQLEQYLLWD